VLFSCFVHFPLFPLPLTDNSTFCFSSNEFRTQFCPYLSGTPYRPPPPLHTAVCSQAVCFPCLPVSAPSILSPKDSHEPFNSITDLLLQSFKTEITAHTAPASSPVSAFAPTTTPPYSCATMQTANAGARYNVGGSTKTCENPPHGFVGAFIFTLQLNPANASGENGVGLNSHCTLPIHTAHWHC
jgi:hypothetical protein